jgi:hypothetical protein
MKKIILMTTAVAAALSAHAQMIDFDLPGKTLGLCSPILLNLRFPFGASLQPDV